MSGEIVRLPVIPRREALSARCTMNEPAVFRRPSSADPAAIENLRAIAARSAHKRRAAHYADLQARAGELANLCAAAALAADDPGEIDTLQGLAACYHEDVWHFGQMAKANAELAADTQKSKASSAFPPKADDGAVDDLISPEASPAAPLFSGPAFKPDDGPSPCGGRRPESCGAVYRPNVPDGAA